MKGQKIRVIGKTKREKEPILVLADKEGMTYCSWVECILTYGKCLDFEVSKEKLEIHETAKTEKISITDERLKRLGLRDHVHYKGKYLYLMPNGNLLLTNTRLGDEV